jgi:hypothetical protein
MKYALLAVGLLLILVGGYFVYTGSNIIEIERGWSAVIAGTTLLSAGIVTVALAAVVKTLDDLKRALSGGEIGVARGAALPLPSILVAEATPTPSFEPMPMAAKAAESMAGASEETPIEAASDFIPSPLGKERPRLTPRFGPPPVPPAPSPAIAGLRRRLAEDLDLGLSDFDPPPIAPTHEPITPGPTSTISPPPLDFDPYADARRPHEAAIEDDPENEAFETAHELPPPLDETEAPLAPEAAFAGSPRPKAIGRYEADGTVYVMFADGSIEAQSNEGTRYFKSMADLKASFQSQT